ncbi:hypothetical protein GJ744_004919 [Endocarpon pusillum]|uniref:CRESS-DNA virus Rep endonuclease domain-containing protein n=1 Tax=Endocarpon pusillum TaxID=364733 RepID=A0A8H7APW7_9EURO|nr:hypothetical protein GJ744_004919 [Endocarpon pusillum]
MSLKSAPRGSSSYSQIPDDFDREGLGPFLKETIGDFEYISCAVEEHHTTGGYHIHSYIDTGRTYITNDARHFDCDDIHPNIKPVRNTPWKAKEYSQKDNDIIFEEGTAPENPEKSSGDDIWHKIMSAGNKEEFLKEAARLKPRDTVLHFSSLQSYANWKYRDNPMDYEGPSIQCHCEDYPHFAAGEANEVPNRCWRIQVSLYRRVRGDEGS